MQDDPLFRKYAKENIEVKVEELDENNMVKQQRSPCVTTTYTP